MDELIHGLLDVSGVVDLFQPEALLYLLLIVALLWVGRLVYSSSVPYDLMATIAQKDNKAATLSFAGFMFGLGLVLWGALTAHGLPSILDDLVDMAIVGALGIALLHVGQRLSDRFIFPGFAIRESIAKENLAAGVAEAGGYVATGLIVMRAVALDGITFWVRLADSVIFFALGQLGFVLFAWIYRRTIRYDAKAAIERGNVAAGISQGLTFIAMAAMLSYAIRQTGSLAVFGSWFVLSGVLLVVFRVFVDRLLLPGHSLDEEIDRDDNWGIAFVEGGLAVIISFILTGAF